MTLKKLSTQNFLIILFVMLISMLSVAFLWIKDIYSTYQKNYVEIKKNYILSQKKILKLHVDSVKNNIENIIEIHKKTNSPVSIKELQQIVLNQLKKYRYGKDGYIFVLNDKGVNLMNPFKPELKNKNLYNLKDKSGKYLVQELIKASTSKNHFVTYFWLQPSTNKIVKKLGYAQNIPQWHWVIGSGLYLDNINKVLQKKYQELKTKIKIRVLQVMMVFVFIFIIISYFLYRRVKKINNSFLMFHNFLKEAHNKSNLMNIDKLEYQEFKDLAKDINNMIQKRIEMEKELKKKNKQMLQQSRLAQMGELLNMIAHQWRQPLTAISATSIMINLKANMNDLSNKEAIELSQKIEDYAKHLSQTIDDFRNFFKSDKNKSRVNLIKLINSVVEMMGVSLIHNKINLRKELNCKEEFLTYPNELKQVLLNLLQNAKEALIEKNIPNPLIIIKTYKKDDKCIIEIIDNAKGVPNEIIDKIFDPYFSTKMEKNGTGLGLYMSKMIIEKQCNGKLEVFNNDNGAVFRIELPMK